MTIGIAAAPLLTSFLLLASLPGSAQECAGGRYRSEVFTEVDVTPAVAFGSNTAVGGGDQLLYMDVYAPAGDEHDARPVVLVTFGGSFVSGSRSDVALVCEGFARRGFVAVSPDYRVGIFIPDASSTTQAVMRGAHDMKACVRHLRSTAVEGGNPYGIDPDRILMGGFSAGAVSALHAAYLDNEAEWPPVLAGQHAELGGVEGNSGTPGWSSDVLGVFSFSGALGDTTWMQPGDVPVCSVHEMGDDVVPYYTQEVRVFGFPTGLVASGSHDVHVRADQLGLDNCLLTYPGNGHVAYVNIDSLTSIGFVMDFCADLVCGQDAACGNVIAHVPTAGSDVLLNTYPNPARDILWVDGAEGQWVWLMNAAGQEVRRSWIMSDHHALDLSGLDAGMYILHSGGRAPQRVVLMR